MLTILIAADEDDKGFWNELSGMLDRYFATVRAYGQKFEASGTSSSSALMLCDMRSFTAIETDRVIVVYKNPQPMTVRLEGPCQAVAIVDSSDDSLLEHVCATRLPAITCGLRSRDTITLSSMAADSAVIDVRRSISCLDGSRVEPQEFPLHLEKPVDSFLLMTIAAILILSGKIERLKEGFM